MTENLTAQELDGIIAKVRKLLALSQSSNEHEAALAAARAQALLFKHNLDMASIDGAEASAYLKNMITLGTGKLVEWKRELVFTLARYNFCRAVAWEGMPVMAVVGQRHNFEVVQGLYDYLSATLLRLVERASVAYKLAGGTDKATSYKAAWLVGAVRGIAQQLHDQQWQQRFESPASNALVLDTTAAVDQAFDNFFGKVGNGKAAKLNSKDGQLDGYRTGLTIGIHRQVKDGTSDAPALT